MNKGRVWLVGAGPGDPGLLTVKAKEVLENAEVVVYDALVGQSVLSLIPASAECINAGKHAGNHILHQYETNEVLYQKAAEGKRVVRLKGGDPYLFGRGGEEAEYLIERGITFEEVPGVTSPMAVPAYNGIPVTHRDFTSSVTFITAHKKKDEPLSINFKAIVDLDGTTVFMMGVSALPVIMKGLLDAGMDKDMPAAILSRGTTSDQKKIVATISTLEAEVEKQGVLTPAVIIVGRVCTLADKLAWIENYPLFGKKILVTRPKGRSSKLSHKLRDLGAEVLEIPSIRIAEIKNNTVFEDELAKINEYSWVVFTSPAGVQIFFDKLKSMKKDVRSLNNIKFAVLGAGTSKELENYGCLYDLMPEVFDNENMANLLKDKLTANDKVMIPRAKIGNPILTEILTKTAATIVDIPVYDTETEKHEWLDLDKMIENREMDLVTFTSASTVHNFVKLAPNTKDFSNILGVCIGRQTREAAEEYGIKTITSEAATIDSLVECILNNK